MGTQGDSGGLPGGLLGLRGTPGDWEQAYWDSGGLLGTERGLRGTQGDSWGLKGGLWGLRGTTGD